MVKSLETTEITRFEAGSSSVLTDRLAVEEPLEIRVGYRDHSKQRVHRTLSITMRTPGEDELLSLGFLFTEGLIARPKDVIEHGPCGPSGNVYRVELSDELDFDLARLERHFYTSSSCGVCGKTSIEALRAQNPFIQHSNSKYTVESKVLSAMLARLRQRQDRFEQSGGLHASGLFDLNGELERVFEDVGRHNALDKLIGNAFLESQIPLERRILLLSGRMSFELIQKAAMAGIGVVAAIGAPSSLAIALAKDLGITAIGFLKESRFNVYSGEWRVRGR